MSAPRSEGGPIPGRISRRNFFTVGFAGVVVGAVGGVALGAEAARQALQLHYEDQLAADVDPDFVFTGSVIIQKGVNVRNSPQIPRTYDGRILDNKIPWDRVLKITGTDISGVDTLVVENPQIVYEKNEDGNYSTWLKLQATVTRLFQIGLEFPQPIYINYGSSTNDFVRIHRSGSWVEVHRDDKGNLVQSSDGLPINEAATGSVLLPGTP